MLAKLSEKDRVAILNSLLNSSATARAAVKRRHDAIAATPVNLDAIKASIASAVHSARPRPALQKVMAQCSALPPAAGFEGLLLIAPAITYDLPVSKIGNLLHRGGFSHEYADAMLQVSRRMSDAEVRAIKGSLDDVSVASTNMEQGAFRALFKELGKRRTSL